MDGQKQVVAFEFKNVNQCEFYDMVMKAVLRMINKRYFFYGGGIRGGKTFVCLYIFIVLARLFPNSRWHVFREDNPALESTVIPSTEKLIGSKGKDFVWKNKAGNKHLLFNNGSKIFFKSENLSNDPNLKEFLGLETNGVLLEQMEALSSNLYARVMERIGSWYIDPMPPPLILGTFNPTQEWVKKDLWDKFENGEIGLEDDAFYLQKALPEDNPFVTEEQWKNWANLDEDSYMTMIGGIWRFKATGNLFAYAFNPAKNVINVTQPGARATEEQIKKWQANVEYMKLDDRLPVYCIFDFNVDPMTCLICQRNGMRWGKVIKEIRLRNSDIYEMTDRIKNEFDDYYIIATGDASGRNRNGSNKGRKSYVQIIKQELRLSDKQIQFPAVNQSIANTRIVMNSILSKHPEFKISSECNFLIDDLETVKTDGKGGIEKGDDKLKTHFLDDLRYFSWNYFRNFVNLGDK